MAFTSIIQVLLCSALVLAVCGQPVNLARKDGELLGVAVREYPMADGNSINNIGYVWAPYDLPNYFNYPIDGVARSALPALPGTQGIALNGQTIVTFMIGLLNSMGILVRDNGQAVTIVQEQQETQTVS